MNPKKGFTDYLLDGKLCRVWVGSSGISSIALVGASTLWSITIAASSLEQPPCNKDLVRILYDLPVSFVRSR
jgi:hypothetical protein